MPADVTAGVETADRAPAGIAPMTAWHGVRIAADRNTSTAPDRVVQLLGDVATHTKFVGSACSWTTGWGDHRSANGPRTTGWGMHTVNETASGTIGALPCPS